MNKWIFVLVGLLTFTIAFSVIFLTTPVQTAPLPDCTILQGNPEKAINILFMTDQATAQQYMQTLLAVEPYKSHKDSLAFMLLESSPTCTYYKGIALYCYSRDILKEAAACPHDVIIVAKEEPQNIRSSSYLGVLSLNKNAPFSVVVHEMGHFFGMDEEYDAQYSPTFNSPNCKSTCDNFPECFTECADGNHKRSVENGVMRTLSPADTEHPYGAYNEAYIASLLGEQARGITAYASKEEASCKDEKTLLIDISSKNGKSEVIDTEIIAGCAPQFGKGSVDYKINQEATSTFASEIEPHVIYTDATENPDVLSGDTFSNEDPYTIPVPAPSGGSTGTININDGATGQSTTYPLSSAWESLCPA